MKRCLIASLSLLAVATAVGCGSGGSERTAARGPAQTASARTDHGLMRESRTDYDLMRAKVVLGLARDFRAGTHAGPPRFAICVRLGMRRALTREQLNRLVAVQRRPDGQQFAAQALNALAAPIGAECGGAKYVPELVTASEALDGDYPLSRLGVAARRLGVTYGPYLGLTCRKAGSTRCDSVGLDVVLRREARAVTAWVGGRRLALRTPGLHSGEAGRDWVGYLDRAGLGRPGSPFHIPSNGRNPGAWAGSPAVYLPVRLEVAYPDETTVTGALPRVFLSPGWG
jgi:hypothetical protein